MIKISVCIPVYGVEKYIERCARSLFEQTMTDGIEFIFVNDCTKDRSIEILERILAEYPGRQAQTKIIHHEINKGLVAARNTGLAHATGDYIIHCDSDDWVDLNLYKTMYKKAVDTDSDVVICSTCHVFSKEKVTVHSIEHIGSVAEYVKKNSHPNFNSLCNKLYKSDIALNTSLITPDQICMGEDLLRNIQMLGFCKKIAVCSDVYYYYYRGNSNASTRSLSRDYFDQFVKVADILKPIAQSTFPGLYSSLQAQVLFSALKTREISSQEFKQLYPEKKKILKSVHLPLWKRSLLYLAMISYPCAKILCSVLLKIKFCR